MNILLWGVIGYVLAQFAIGAYVSRRMTDDRDYIVAGRSLSFALVAFSVFATWFGAEAIQTSAGEIYANGLAGSRIDPFGYGIAVLAVGLLIAARIWRTGATTYADVIRERYSAQAEKLFVFVLLPGSLFWAAAQMRSFGALLTTTADIELEGAIALAAGLIAAYSVVGGLLADAVTDVLQGLVVIIGLVILTFLVANHVGGVSAGLAAVPVERLTWGSDDTSTLELLEKIAITICGSLVAVELVSRFLGASSAGIARNGTVAGGVMYLIVGLMPVFLGLVGPGLVPDLKEAEQIVPKLAEKFLPGGWYAVFVGALVSAILSVAHATLHAPAAQVSHNIINRLKPDMRPQQRLTVVRLTVLALSMVAFALALSMTRVRELVELASAFGSAGAIVVVLFGLFSHFGGPASAIAALAAGAGVWAWARFMMDLKTPYLLGLGAAFAAYVGAALIERRTYPRNNVSAKIER
jgi:Na+/proline symporter